MGKPRLRPAARGLIVDDSERILLCRFEFPGKGLTVWATPGGGVQPGETPLEALQRELTEEIGLTVTEEPPHVWHQQVIADGHAPGYDGVINDYYFIRTTQFSPSGSMSIDELRTENVTAFRWWHLSELLAYRGEAVFSPRDLGGLLDQLLRTGVPSLPLRLGL